MSAAAAPARAPARGIPVLLFAGLVLGVWADPLFFRRNFTGRDLLPYNLPMEKAIHDAYAAGRLPLWNPYISGGRPLLPNPNAGALYPVRPLLSLLPFPVAMRIFPTLHWFASGAGMLLLLSEAGLSPAGAWIGAVTYVFSGVSVSDVFFPHIHPGMTLLPWILWAVARRGLPAGRRVLWLGAFFGLDLLAADVFTVCLAVAAAALWIALETETREQMREIAALGGGVLLGALVAAPQIVATSLWIPETNRAVLGMRLSEVTLFSLRPLRLLELVVPYPFGRSWELHPRQIWGWVAYGYKALGLFLTLYAGALATIALFAVWRERRAGLRFARVLLVIGLAVAMIPSLLPRSWGNVKSPLPLRNPEKLAVGIALALAIFAAHGLERYRRRGPGKVPLAVGVLLAALAAAAFVRPLGCARLAGRLLGVEADRIPAAATHLAPALAEAGLLWVGTLIALELLRLRSRAAGAAALLLLTAVPIFASRRIGQVAREEEVLAPRAFALRVRRADPHGAFRVLGEGIYRAESAIDPLYELSDMAVEDEPRRAWTEHTQVLWGYGTVFNIDFDSGDLARLESLRRVSGLAAGYRDAGPFFGNLALRWGIRMRRQPAVSNYRETGGQGPVAWDELRPALPDIRLATAWREEVGSLQALDALHAAGPGVLVLETGRQATGSARPGRLRVIEKSPNRLRLMTETSDPTWLFVLRDYWTHRTVLLDGRPAECVPAYLAFSAVAIPAGTHRIEWRERLPGAALSRFGPALAAVAAAILFARRPRAPGRSV